MIQDSDIAGIIQADHETLVNDYSWARRRGDVLLTTVAIYSTGAVTTSGTTVTGIGTIFTSSMVNRYIRIGSDSWFAKITAFNSPTSLTIESTPPTAITTATAFQIFQHIYPLPSDFGRVTSVTGDVRLREWARSEIDRIDPYRVTTATRPDVYTMDGLTAASGGFFQIEFWPVPNAAQAVRIEYLKVNSLSADSDEPMYRSDVLIWKAGESCSFFLHGKTGDAAWLALADRFHERYKEALQGAREDDLGKYATPTYIRDRNIQFGRGDDFFLSHDPLWLRRG